MGRWWNSSAADGLIIFHADRSNWLFDGGGWTDPAPGIDAIVVNTICPMASPAAPAGGPPRLTLVCWPLVRPVRTG